VSPNRIIYENWIVEMGRDPALPVGAVEAESDEDRLRTARIKAAVQTAVATLDDEEREFVRQFYYMGRSYRELSERTGRLVHRLESLHKRVRRKLRGYLAPLVAAEYNLRPQSARPCPICNSSYCRQIDQLIARRDPKATWRPVIAEIRQRFELSIRSPQILIGHEKYHRQQSHKKGPKL